MLKQLTTDMVVAEPHIGALPVDDAPAHPAEAPPSGVRRVRLEWRVILVLALAAGFVTAQFWVQREHLLSGPPNDFLLAYSSAKALGAADIYDPAGLAFRHSPLVAMLTAPLAALPYPNAYWLWSVIGVWSVIGFVFLWRPPAPGWTALGAVVSAPLFATFLDGRATPLLLLFLAAGIAAARAKQDFRGGLWLSLCLIEFQLFLLLPLALIAQRRWAMLRGLTLGGLVLAALSTWSAGVDWPWRMAEAWRAYPTPAAAMPNLAGAFAGLEFGIELTMAVGFVLALLVWTVSVKTDLAPAVGCALAAGLLLAPRADLADAVLLLPAALAVYATARLRTLRWAALLLLTPLPYLLGGAAHSMRITTALTLAFLGLIAVDKLSASRAPAPARALHPEAQQRA